MREFGQVVRVCGRVSCLLVIPALAAWATGRPFIFPSLGPSAFALAVREDQISARRIIGGHFVGICCGLLAYHLVASGLTFHLPRATWSANDLRLAASGILALLLTTAGMLTTRMRHAPSCATTLIISLGLMPSLIDSAIIMFGVLTLCGTDAVLCAVAALHRGPHVSRAGKHTSGKN